MKKRDPIVITLKNLRNGFEFGLPCYQYKEVETSLGLFLVVRSIENETWSDFKEFYQIMKVEVLR